MRRQPTQEGNVLRPADVDGLDPTLLDNASAEALVDILRERGTNVHLVAGRSTNGITEDLRWVRHVLHVKLNTEMAIVEQVIWR